RELERMPRARPQNNTGAAGGRGGASHWKTAVFGWLVFVVAAFMIGAKVGTKNIKEDDYNTGQAHKADMILKDGFPKSDALTEIVLIQSSKLSVNASAFRSTVNDVVGAGQDDPAVRNG